MEEEEKKEEEEEEEKEGIMTVVEMIQTFLHF